MKHFHLHKKEAYAIKYPRILSSFNSLCFAKIAATVNCGLPKPSLATGTEVLLAGLSTLKAVVLVKALSRSLIGQLLFKNNSGQ